MSDNTNYILDDMGEAFICPWEDKQNKMLYIPINKLYLKNYCFFININIYFNELNNLFL